MKFSALPLLLVGAGLAVEQAGALSVLIKDGVPIVSMNIKELQPVGVSVVSMRMGHAAANVGPVPVPQIMAMPADRQRQRKGCSKTKMRGKAIEIANSFRQTFGLPLIKVEEGHGWAAYTPAGVYERPQRQAQAQEQAAFVTRVHRALMTLGPWEGRAVAFVLGCGIGVLLRMVWVFVIVAARALQGQRTEPEDEIEYTLVFEHGPADAEDLVVPPPRYTDEKVDVEDAKV